MKLVVEEKEERIDKYLVTQLDYSRSHIQNMIIHGDILVNGETVKSNYVVKIDDVIDVNASDITMDILPENIALDIIYEDEYLMVINKPSGMVVHPGNGNTEKTMVNALMYYTKYLSNKYGDFRPGIVHRIDKDTSGLIIVAKDNKTHEILSGYFKDKKIKREYLALLTGEFKGDTATIDAPIGRDVIERKRMSVTSKNSKKAITHLTVLKRYKEYTLVKLNLETGRTHQIRVHMKYIGYPLFNDPVYSKKASTSFGQFLHSSTLDFSHPITNEKLHFECPLPTYFADHLESLELIN